jgi:hypothetical protein
MLVRIGCEALASKDRADHAIQGRNKFRYNR